MRLLLPICIPIKRTIWSKSCRRSAEVSEECVKCAALFPGILLLGAAEPVMFLAGGWLGFAFGVVVSLSVLKFGFFGLGVGLLLTIPQGLFYVAGALVMFQGLADWKWNFANWLAFPGRKLMTGTVFFFLGILTESFVSLWNLRLLFYLI